MLNGVGDPSGFILADVLHLVTVKVHRTIG
jgi:hypothetical protein